jgi:hypothetical protein
MADLLPMSSPLSPERRLDVVFVHGLGGNPITTWHREDDASCSWPHWLAEEFGEQIGVWSLGYATASPLQPRNYKVPFIGKADSEAGAPMPLPRRAGNSLERLARQGIGQRPVCFIAHSLGGLLVKSILRRADEARDTPAWRQVGEQCRGVLFLATPHQGSGWANLANAFRIILPTVNTDDLRDNDAHLMELYGWYRDYAPRHNIRTLSYYETKTCKGMAIVVKPSSADPGVSGPLAHPPVALDRDHLEISKPRDSSDLAYLGSKDLIMEILQDQPPSPSPSAAHRPPDPTPASSVVVRSFLAGVEEADTLIDLSDLFVCADSKDRRPKHPDVWTRNLPVRLAAAAATIERLLRPVGLAALTHLSIAWYLGSLLPPKRGVAILLCQRGANAADRIWDGSAPRLPRGAQEWIFERIALAEGRDLALVVSVTHNALRDAQHSIAALGLAAGEIHHARLPNPGRAAIQDGGHARWLADALTTRLQAEVTRLRPARLHLFAACPVSLAFLLGQQADVLGPTTAYEYRFGEDNPLYFPGMATGRPSTSAATSESSTTHTYRPEEQNNADFA